MTPLTRSGLYRAGRTILQLVAVLVVVLGTDGVAQAVGVQLDLSPEQIAGAVAVLTPVAAFLHRRFLDPSPVPSLNEPAVPPLP